MIVSRYAEVLNLIAQCALRGEIGPLGVSRGVCDQLLKILETKIEPIAYTSAAMVSEFIADRHAIAGAIWLKGRIAPLGEFTLPLFTEYGSELTRALAEFAEASLELEEARAAEDLHRIRRAAVRILRAKPAARDALERLKS